MEYFFTFQNVQVNKEEFTRLSQDAAGLIALLGYWAAKGFEVYAGLESLCR